MKNTVLILLLTFFYACAISPDEGNGCGVEYEGALKNIMRKGDLSAKADLKEFENEPNLYALGAVKDLKGEILIWNSKPIISSQQNQKMEISHTFDKEATLLVYANVEQWDSFVIPSHISTYEEFEKFVVKTADENGVNSSYPFPFLIQGNIQSLDWHVINWKDGDTEHSHEKHIKSGLYGKMENADVDILGFYSKHHHAIFTHHTTNMHLHFKTKDNSKAGHIDNLILGKEMILKIPHLKN